MKRSGITILLLLFLSSSPLHCLLQEELPVVSRGEHRLPMQARDGLIYVKAEVNGIPAKLLVDTAAVLPSSPLESY